MKSLPDFRFIPVISDALPQDQWSGRTGFVHRAVMEDHPDLSGHQVYACGAPIVVQSAQKDFVRECRLPEEEFLRMLLPLRQIWPSRRFEAGEIGVFLARAA